MDIEIIKKRDRAYVIPKTPTASKYLRGKHIEFEHYFTVPAEEMEELINSYLDDGYTVEVS